METVRVEVGRPERLTFGDVQRGSDGVVLSMVVAAELNGLTARRDVVSHYKNGFDDLALLFTDLAEHWRGWSGTKDYRSIEGDLLLQADHTGSHVELHFTLQDSEFHNSWSARGKLTLDAGEELARVSEDLKKLFSPPQEPIR
ncbi:DUF6228 family protein [Pseudarthrobacter sp. S3]|uniref:DUF6228 family protein n=1 Tax=Pseudarthrobacter sp. S3 TaxID=3418419 RepID=UPI003CF4933D